MAAKRALQAWTGSPENGPHNTGPHVQGLHCGTRSSTEPSMPASSHHISASRGLHLQPPVDPAPSDRGTTARAAQTDFPSVTLSPMSRDPTSAAGSTGFHSHGLSPPAGPTRQAAVRKFLLDDQRPPEGHHL